MLQVSRLSSMPLFLRGEHFWGRLLDPKTLLSADAKYRELREAAGSHRWSIDSEDTTYPALNRRQIGVLDIAQGLLERGLWTPPTWQLEQHIANLFRSHLGWELSESDGLSGTLAINVINSTVDDHFKQALVTGRWQAEAPDAGASEIWESQRIYNGEVGSNAEQQFLESVLKPVLGFPLLDFLHLQRDLVSLGLDPVQFAQQRADFVLETGRGHKLVIEVDGGQHLAPAQLTLDRKRDSALKSAGWQVWRVPTHLLDNPKALQASLKNFLKDKKGNPLWGHKQLISAPRPRQLMTCVWGATTASRLQFLVLEALRNGHLPWEGIWRLQVIEHDTDIADAALTDLIDWFGRLRELHGFSPCPSISLSVENEVDLIADISVLQPYRAAYVSHVPVAWSRPANFAAPTPKRKFASGMFTETAPDKHLLETFVQDLFRKTELREGQWEILCRIMAGKDVVGLLPTGGGKSLTYQLPGLLLGGLTLYVSPLKSLLQDQRERLVDLGIDLAQEISSALTPAQRRQARVLLTSGGIRFLLIAPERFLIDTFRNELDQFRVSYGEVCQVVVDECHCVSEWGHDFRAAYLSLSRIAKARTQRLGLSSPLVALTGTASSIVLSDVQRELGINESDAVIRAKRLDRPEIALTCLQVPQSSKQGKLRTLAADFLVNHPSNTQGLLVFCRFIGGAEGVMAATANLLSVVPQEKLKFYCGEEPDWKSYAAFCLGQKADALTKPQIAQCQPTWAVSPNHQLNGWDNVKAETQRSFISDLKNGFPVLVATNAFGMGIDKPSIRSVIHYMSPQSPEAYYQEVGRAARDRNPANAVLLFSDENPSITDQILSPELSIKDAKAVYDRFRAKDKWGGGDFIRTFYFHQNSFIGADLDAKHLEELFREIRRAQDGSEALVFKYISADTYDKLPQDKKAGNASWAVERNLEYSVVRLIHLGVIRDYTKDYNAKSLKLSLNEDWLACKDNMSAYSGYLAGNFRTYLNRYQVRQVDTGEQAIREATSIELAEATSAKALVDYIYDQIERKRRQASRQMLEFARRGVTDPSGFREVLLMYLQVSEKFTEDLEALVADTKQLSWTELLLRVDSRDEVKELHGACQRVLESYPTHPGLLAISAITRLNPTKDGLKRSEEEFKAALHHAMLINDVVGAKEHGDAMVNYCSDVDDLLAERLEGVYGLWLIQNGRKEEAIARFFIRKPVRDYWLAKVLREVRTALPSTQGL